MSLEKEVKSNIVDKLAEADYKITTFMTNVVYMTIHPIKTVNQFYRDLDEMKDYLDRI